jgi:hypothetical protein
MTSEIYIMKEHPILMKAPLVRATLEGRKTQTRRPVKCGCNHLHEGGNPVKLFGDWSLSVPPHQYDGAEDLYGWRGKRPKIGDWIETVQTDVDDCFTSFVPCPLGRAGDRIWVRETFAYVTSDHGEWYQVRYAADTQLIDWEPPTFKPSIHMPRWACRLVLPLVSVRVERAQDITEEDAIAEGVPHNSDRPIGKSWCAVCLGHGIVERFALGMVSVDDCSECNSAKKLFRNIWISIYGQKSWDSNPWVWVAEWKEIEVSR